MTITLAAIEWKEFTFFPPIRIKTPLLSRIFGRLYTILYIQCWHCVAPCQSVE